MGLQLVLATPAEQPEIRDFLLKIFEADLDLNSFRPEVLHWKYFAPHPDWQGSRSYLLKNDGKIAAHASVWPIRLTNAGPETKGIHLLDWAASKSTPGAGIQMVRRAAEMGDVLIAIGGSAYTREILPKFGYKRGGELKRYVYVPRPWKQLRTSRRYNWKTPLRFLRNAASTIKRIPEPPSGWQATQVARFDASIEQILERPSIALRPRSIRTAAALNYVLDCPAAKFTGFAVSDGKRPRGYFVLVKVGRQARIADIQVDADHPQEWGPICRLAARVACQDPDVCEVIVGTSRTEVGESFEQLGFWARRIEPIFYYDPRKLIDPAVRFELSLIDNDFAFFYNPENPFIS
jgi:hypothetical protein